MRGSKGERAKGSKGERVKGQRVKGSEGQNVRGPTAQRAKGTAQRAKGSEGQRRNQKANGSESKAEAQRVFQPLCIVGQVPRRKDRASCSSPPGDRGGLQAEGGGGKGWEGRR